MTSPPSLLSSLDPAVPLGVPVVSVVVTVDGEAVVEGLGGTLDVVEVGASAVLDPSSPSVPVVATAGPHAPSVSTATPSQIRPQSMPSGYQPPAGLQPQPAKLRVVATAHGG